MSFKSRVHFVILIIFGFVAEVFFLGYLVAKPLGAADTPPEQKIFLPASVPERNRLRPISIVPVTVEGEIDVATAAIARLQALEDFLSQRLQNGARRVGQRADQRHDRAILLLVIGRTRWATNTEPSSTLASRCRSTARTWPCRARCASPT